MGIATNGTDIWIVDNKADKVYRYSNAADRTSGTQSAASNFSLNSGNRDPSDIVTDGNYLWVVNNGVLIDKVFKYTVAGTYVGSWTITTSGARTPTGITLDPSNVSHLWIVDSGTDRVYQYNDAAGLTSGSRSANSYFALASGNTNPQGIADPPASGAPVSPAAAGSDTDAALVSLYAMPMKQTPVAPRVLDKARRIVRVAGVESASPQQRPVAWVDCASLEPGVRIVDEFDWGRDHRRQANADDLFAQWESDELQLLGLAECGMSSAE